MNCLNIVGNLTRDPETKTLDSGKTVCSFTVAVNRRRKVEGQPEADFFRVSAWGQMGEVCQKFLSKGRKVAITGSVSARGYQAQDGTARASLEVLAGNVEFLTPKGEGETASKPGSGAMQDVSGDVDGELPF